MAVGLDGTPTAMVLVVGIVTTVDGSILVVSASMLVWVLLAVSSVWALAGVGDTVLRRAEVTVLVGVDVTVLVIVDVTMLVGGRATVVSVASCRCTSQPDSHVMCGEVPVGTAQYIPCAS